jgi:hypothetical protein
VEADIYEITVDPWLAQLEEAVAARTRDAQQPRPPSG